MWLIAMALRNLFRHPWRTTLTGLAVTLSVALVVTATNFEYGAWQDRLETSIRSTSGHVVISSSAYVDDPHPKHTITQSSAAAEALRQSFPDARVYRRALVGGLLASPRNSARILIQGVEPLREADATRLDDTIVTPGAWLEPGDEVGVVIGATIAEILEVSVGDKVVLMVQIGDDMQSAPLRVRGIYRTGVQLTDAFTGMADLAALRAVLPGDDPAHQLAIHVRAAADAPSLRGRAETALGRPELRVQTWDQALPELKRQMELDNQMSAVIYQFIFVIVAVVILTTLLMSVLERVREFGLLLALGMRPRQVAALVLVEALILGVGASLLGLVVQAPVTWYLMVYGVDYGDMMTNSTDLAGVVLDPVLRARWNPSSMLFYSASAAGLTVLAGVWPAWRATRLAPVDAMRSL
jgi:ABC-type lipoprotein release transport system permease subunit